MQEAFIPVAIDQDYHRRQKDVEGIFYRKIVSGRYGKDYKSGNTQGFYICTASGEFLAYSNHRFPEVALRFIKDGISKYQPSSVAPIKASKNTSNWNPHLVPPKGGLVIRTNSKVLSGYKKSKNREQSIYQSAISRDNLWTTKEEHEALVKGVLMDSLTDRICRFHLVDATRGSPSFWKKEDFTKIDIRLINGVITGTISVENTSRGWGHTADILGYIESENGKVTRFDVIAKGPYWGGGHYSRNPPPGKYLFGTSFTLADGSQLSDNIPPEGTKGWPPKYIQMKR